MRFEYERAYREVARPAFEALPDPVRELVSRVGVAAETLRQLPDLTMPWPAASDVLRNDFAAFASVDPEGLAYAARVVWSAGHWAVPAEAVMPGDGRYWKFAHYADQTLRAALGLPAAVAAHPRGLSLSVHQGVLRLAFSSSQLWTWVEVAAATPEGLALARGLEKRHFGLTWDCAVSAFMQLKVEAAATWTEPWAALMNTDQYMVERV